MALISSIFLSIAFILAVALGPQTRAWSWGPALVFLALASLAALPVVWRSRKFFDPWVIFSGAAAVCWFAWRAWISPVKDGAVSDLLLLAGAVGAFLATRASCSHRHGISVLIWSVAGLVAASVAVISVQLKDPLFVPILGSRPADLPSGLYLHYNEGANFLIGASCLLAAFAFSGRQPAAVRIVWGVIAFAGMAGVYFTRSRGGILALAVALLALTVMVLIHGRRNRAPWFGAAAIGLPLLAGGAIIFTLFAWLKAQEVRGQEVSVSYVLDNNVRLQLLGIAFSCIASHPWAGGGSRSFSWECYQFWNVKDHGRYFTRPEMVHNEFLQAVTDYGIIGGALLSVFLIPAVLHVMVRGLVADRQNNHPYADALHAGGLAAFAGMFVQSSFSFVFHLLPGTVLLGIALACMCLPSGGAEEKSKSWNHLPKILLSLVCLGVVAISLPYGWKGLRIMRTVWPVYFSPAPLANPALRADLLAEALHIWPQASLYKDRALGLHTLVHRQLTEGDPTPALEEAIADYRAGLERNPNDITLSLNLGNLLNQAGRDEEALAEYLRSVRLQGGVEIGFRAHSRASELLLKMGRKQLADKRFEDAVLTFASAVEHYDEAAAANSEMAASAEGTNLRKLIWDGLGVAQESTGDFDSALETYRRATERGATYGHYRAGNLLGRMAESAHAERKASLAHSLFLKAREEMSATKEEIPPDATREGRDKQLAYFEEMIQFFVTARVPPLEEDK